MTGLGLLLALTHFVFYVFVLAPFINGLSHWWGRRSFRTKSATNVRVLAWLPGGESLHNNHHASFVIPALNEEANIADAVREAVAAMGDRFRDYELLLFDDGSTDRTGSIVDALAAADPRHAG